MRAFISILILTITGCAGPGYRVTQLDDRFTDFTTYSAEGNRVSSQSVAGGVHIDGKGVQINPMVEVDDGGLRNLYLTLLNVTDYSTQYGSPNSIGIPRSIELLADGQKIMVALSGEKRFADTANRNTVDRSLTIDSNEYGIGIISPQDFATIVHASELVIRINGSRQSHTYEGRDIDPSFRANLRSFYEQYVDY